MNTDRAALADAMATICKGSPEAIFVAYLDALPSKFGSAKLAHEADLVLAALAAAGLKVREVLPVLDDALEEAGIQAVRQGQNAWALTCFTAQLALWADGHIPPAAPTAWNDLAGTYIQRGVAKQSVEGQGLRAAIEDYEQGVAIRLSLRALLEPRGVWDLPLRNDLALAYSNRGNAKLSAAGHGPEASIDDYDRAIEGMLAAEAKLEPKDTSDPSQRISLATAYINRGIAKEDYRPAASLADYDQAIAILEEVHALLEPKGAWTPRLQNELSVAYMRRGKAIHRVAGCGPRASIEDHDRAVGAWRPSAPFWHPRTYWTHRCGPIWLEHIPIGEKPRGAPS